MSLEPRFVPRGFLRTSSFKTDTQISQTWKLGEAAAALEDAHVNKAIEAELHHFAESIVRSKEFQDIERGINDALFEVSRFGSALEKLVTDGPMGYIEETTRDERANLKQQINLYDQLVRDCKKLERALIDAKKALEAEKSRLKPEQEEARVRIAELEAEIKLKPFEKEYEMKKQDFDRIKTQADALISTLEDIKASVEIGADVLWQVSKIIMEGIPEITDIYVEASSDAIAENKPMTFSITARWLGQDHICRVDWSPNQGVQELYGRAAEKVVALADEV